MAEELGDKGRIALEAAQLGLYVLPLQATGKIPKIPQSQGGQGYKDATRDETQVKALWAKYPNANIGVRVGFGPPVTKLLVMDVDNKGGKNGSEVLDKIETRLGVSLPKAVTVSTPNLGFQYYVRYPEEFVDELLHADLGVALGLGEGVEIKAKGYVLLPGSHISGDNVKVKRPANKGFYVFENGVDLANVFELLPELPLEFVKACVKPAPDTKEWDEVRKHQTRNDKGETLSEKYDITMAKVFTPPRDAIKTTDGYRIKHPVHGSTNPHNVSIKMDSSEWFCHRHNHGGDALEYYAMCEGLIKCGERLRGDAVSDTLKKLRDEGIISEVLVGVPEKQKVTVEAMAQHLAEHPEELYAVYRATIDDYHHGDSKLKTILWRASFRISFSWVVSLIHLDASGPTRSGKTSITVKFLSFIPDENFEMLFSASPQALWHLTVKDGKCDPTYYAGKILVILDTPEGALLEVLKAACEEYEETPMDRTIATDKAGQVMKFSINGLRMVVLCSVAGVADSHGQIASRCLQIPTDEQTDEHRTSRALLNSQNDAEGYSITKDPRTAVIKRAREILDTAIRRAGIRGPSADVKDLMTAISLMLVNDGFNETQKRQFEALCLCGAAEKIFERDPEGKTIQIQKEDVLEAWGIFNEFFEFASVNLNWKARAVLNVIPGPEDGMPHYSGGDADLYEKADNHASLVTANDIAEATGIGITRIYEITQSRATSSTKVGPLHDNELIQSTLYRPLGRTVYWLTEKGVKAKRAKRKAIALVVGNGETREYHPQTPEVDLSLLDSITGYYELLRPYYGNHYGASKGSTGMKPEIKELDGIITISLLENESAGTKEVLSEKHTSSPLPEENRTRISEKRNGSETDHLAAPDNGEGPLKPPDQSGTKPELQVMVRNGAELENKSDNAEIIRTIRETILTWPFRDGQKVSLGYAVSVFAASIRRRYPNAGRELEYQINRLAVEDLEIQTFLAERTETENDIRLIDADSIHSGYATKKEGCDKFGAE